MKFGNDRKKKTVLIVLCIVIAVLLIYLFTRQDTVYLNNSDTVQTVLPVTIGGGDASWESCMNEVASAYMKENPDVKIEIRTTANIENIDYEKGLRIEEAKGDLNGIVEMRNVDIYQANHKLAEIPDSLAEKMQAAKKINGKVYSIPRYYSCYGMIYNKEIFEKYNLTEPKTYSEFLELCEKLKENGVTPLAMGAGDLWHLDNWLKILFSKDVLNDNPNWIARCNEGEVHWTDPDVIHFLTEFKELFDKGYVNSEYDVAKDSETIEQLASGQNAMLCSGTWMFSQIEKVSPQFQIGWFFIPTDDEGENISLDGGWEWSITKACEEEGLYDIAVDFLEFYYRTDIYQKVLQDMNGISSLKEDVEYEMIPVQQQLIKEAKEYGTVAEASIGTGETPEGFANKLYSDLLEMVQGKHTVQETAEVLEDEWRNVGEK